MSTYKTPDVYVEEISMFPPSVAEVETAIPSFIGYTEKAEEFGKDLKFVPRKVTSLLEYNELFGGAPPTTISEVALDENNSVTGAKFESKFYMYDSLRLFFKNGGGKCYIISIGTYKGQAKKADFETGLNKLKKEDEPTIILFPDAVLLGGDIYGIQQAALKQCNDLQDRVAVFDLLEPKNPDNSIDWEKGVEDFRNNIGMNFLKYGAAYTPWLKTNFDLKIGYRDFQKKIKKAGKAIDFEELADKDDAKNAAAMLDNAISDTDKVTSDVNSLAAGKGSARLKYQSLVNAFKGDVKADKLKPLFSFIYDMAVKVDEWAGKEGILKGKSLMDDIKNLIKTSIKSSLEKLIAFDMGGEYKVHEGRKTMKFDEWKDIFDKSKNKIKPDKSIFTGATEAEKMLNAEPAISKIFNEVDAVATLIVNSARGYEKTYEDSLSELHKTYQNVKKKIVGMLNTQPPSGAVAGIYAMVDSTRGVWKAPANVSLSGVVGVTEHIDSKEQESLNVDVVAGKSINAIRPFTGKGTLIWGARTLAGNDNEWRYVPVRRFFNMVEESVKKSTYWAVFEPNDANTWIKVKSMIENYLTQKWRDGALAGAVPKEAFFVKIGLGVTMTAQDILEGRMNVEIGMAAVRPAEFIILKFSHKLQES